MMSRKASDRKENVSHHRCVSSLRPIAQQRQQSGERGYTLIALLAVMTIILLLITAAAPNIRQQTQRSREEEAIARGEEVAEAIKAYTKAKGSPPTSIEQLLEGIPSGTKKRQILRPSAAIDPLTESGEWKFIKRTDAAFLAFQKAVTVYAGGRTPTTKDTDFVGKSGGPLPIITNILNTGTKEDAKEGTTGGEDDSTNSTGPFIGVASRSKRDSVITYYGIERHNEWVFTPYFK